MDLHFALFMEIDPDVVAWLNIYDTHANKPYSEEKEVNRDKNIEKNIHKELADDRWSAVNDRQVMADDRRSAAGDIVLIKKADIILIALLVCAGLALSFFMSFGKGDGEQIKVTASGKTFGVYSLLENREVEVDQDGRINRFKIEDGTVTMVDSTCKGKDCIHEGSVSKTGETLVCLPNQVIIEVIGGEGDFDAISK